MSNSGEPRSEKRGNARRSRTTAVRLQVQSQELEAVHRDISSSGAFVVTSEDLIIQLIREDDPDHKMAPARIVRLEKLPGDCIGIALEYLPPE